MLVKCQGGTNTLLQPNTNTNRQTNTIIQIQGVKRKDSGNYTCRVANTEGEGVSNVVALAVQCELHCGDLVIDDGDDDGDIYIMMKCFSWFLVGFHGFLR